MCARGSLIWFPGLSSSFRLGADGMAMMSLLMGGSGFGGFEDENVEFPPSMHNFVKLPTVPVANFSAKLRGMLEIQGGSFSPQVSQGLG